MTQTQSLLNDLYFERGEWLDTQAHRTRLLDRNGYYLEADPGVMAKIADITEQIEIVETLDWLESAEADAAEFAEDVRERADLYAAGMGR